MIINAQYDVIIMGGGLAGLSLSLQLKKANPDIRVLVTEKRKHPAPEAAFKVGESTIEIGARYFADIIGVREHLSQEQLYKPGLIFYLTAGDNTDITKRIEFGQKTYPKHDAFQIDRGKFENHLADKVREAGIDFRDGCAVRGVELNDGAAHEVTIAKGDTEETFTTRWVVDASGRAAIIKRKLGLSVDIDHPASAAWFRVGTKISVEDWSDDPEWQERIAKKNTRWLSTNHLMGSGYWVWLIPLAGDSTSIGIVADERFHPLNTYNSLEKAMNWLKKHEPQCYHHVSQHQDKVLDFLACKKYARNCERLFSTDRWTIVGEAGCFLDPFYSTGSDLIAFANTFSTDLITREMAGEDIAERVDKSNEIFVEYLYKVLFKTYRNQYQVMGNPKVFIAKLLWDGLWYWSVFALLFYQGKLTDVDYLKTIWNDLELAVELEHVMQALFVSWHEQGQNRAWEDFYVDQDEIFYALKLEGGLSDDLTDDELRVRLKHNLGLMENLVRELLGRAVTDLGLPSIEGKKINPYGVSLSPERWEEDGMFVGEHAGPSTNSKLAEDVDYVLSQVVPAKQKASA